jgi:hypothetical protein
MTRNQRRRTKLVPFAALTLGAWLAAPAAADEYEHEESGAEESASADRTSASTAAQGELKAGQIAANPEPYLGKTVTVRAEVETAFGSRIFTLDEDRVGAGPDVLVLVPEHASVNVGDEVAVSGEVRRFSWTELRRDFEWFDLQPSFDVVLRSRPVIVAKSVKGAEGRELAGRAQQASLGQLGRQPGDYYGDYVSVRAPVGEIESPHVFTLEGEGGRPEVLVLNPAPSSSSKLPADAQVSIEGVVRPFFMADLERDYDWFGADQDLVMKIKDRPVIIAESIRTQSGQELVRESAEKPTASR